MQWPYLAGDDYFITTTSHNMVYGFLRSTVKTYTDRWASQKTDVNHWQKLDIWGYSTAKLLTSIKSNKESSIDAYRNSA